MHPDIHTPRRSFAFNALIVAAVVMALVIAGAIIWRAWTQGSLTAVDEAHDAIVQPVATAEQGGAGAAPGAPTNQDRDQERAAGRGSP